MDLKGVNRIKPPLATIAADVRNRTKDSSDRDAQGHGGYSQPEKPKQLTPEQEAEAVQALNAHPSFTQSGLRAELVREEGKAPHVVVRDASGKVVRHMGYDEIVNLYLQRKGGSGTGMLLNRAA
jgi:predicted phage gp36 major capsid-like protein